MSLCGRCYDDVKVEALVPASCSHNPEKTAGAIGMYHCPECGAMVLAGYPHPMVCALCRGIPSDR